MPEQKRYPPSLRKLGQARRNGDIARSGLLTAASATIAGVAALPWVSVVLRPQLFERYRLSPRDLRTADMVVSIRQMGEDVLCATLPVVVVVAVVTIAVELMQTGGIVWSPLRVHLDRLNPFVGLRRLWALSADSARRGLPMEIGWRLSVVVLTSIVFGAPLLWIPFDIERGAALLRAALSCYLGLLLISGFAATILARRQQLVRLSMDLDEVRRDRRESEGDPHFRSIRRELHRSMSFDDCRAQLPIVGSRTIRDG